MNPSTSLSAELQSSDSERLGLAADMPRASSLASPSCSAVPRPHFGSVDALRTDRDRRASAVAVDVSPSPYLLASKPLPIADLLAASEVFPALARIAADDELSPDAHSIGQETYSDSDSWASATGGGRGIAAIQQPASTSRTLLFAFTC